MLDMIYGLAVRLRNAAYDNGLLRREQADIPVVSIGNIQVGGTGKTPLAAWAMNILANEGLRVAYLSRGYGRESQGFKKVRLDGDWQEFGDEALLIANRFPNFPVGVCEDRAEGVRMLSEAYDAEIVVLDDAFQHRRMRRNFDVVTIDVSRNWEKDKLLPFGRLREPWTSLARCDWIVASKLKDLPEVSPVAYKLSRWAKPCSFCRPRLQAPVQVAGPSMESPKRAVSFSGLGNNEAFVRNLQSGPWDIEQHFSFPDHHPFTRKDILQIRDGWKAAAGKTTGELPVLLTTEKDYFRIRKVQYLEEWHDIPLAYVPMELEWLEGEESLAQALIKMKHEQ